MIHSVAITPTHSCKRPNFASGNVPLLFTVALSDKTGEIRSVKGGKHKVPTNAACNPNNWSTDIFPTACPTVLTRNAVRSAYMCLNTSIRAITLRKMNQAQDNRECCWERTTAAEHPFLSPFHTPPTHPPRFIF